MVTHVSHQLIMPFSKGASVPHCYPLDSVNNIINPFMYIVTEKGYGQTPQALIRGLLQGPSDQGMWCLLQSHLNLIQVGLCQFSLGKSFLADNV